MNVRLNADLFVPPVEHSLIATFFRYPIDGRHRIDADLADPSIDVWLKEQSPGFQEEIQFAVSLSAREEALGPSHTRVVVGKFQASEWTARPLRIRLADARSFLERPFELLLEDRVSDRDFLLKMLTTEERQFVEKRIMDGFLRIEHGGGLQSMRKRIEEDSKIASTHHVRWVLFDSDALQPGQPSAESESLRISCGSTIPHHQLRRRHSESYLPGEALNFWATRGTKKNRHERFERVATFLKMRSEQRHHFNMKAGFQQDSKRTDSSSGNLYDDVTEDDKLCLNVGFGSDIGSMFSGPIVTEISLRRDSGWAELRSVVVDLLARVR